MPNEYMLLVQYTPVADFILVRVNGREQIAQEHNKFLLHAMGDQLIADRVITAYMVIQRCGGAVYAGRNPANNADEQV